MNGPVIAILGYVVSAVVSVSTPAEQAVEQPESVCSTVPVNVPHLQEIAPETLKSDGNAAYQLEWAEIRVESVFPNGATASAAVSVRPTGKGFVPTLHCQNTTNALGSALEAVLSGPLTIKTSDLSLSGWMDANISVGEKTLLVSEVSFVDQKELGPAEPRIDIQVSPTVRTPTLVSLKAALAKEGPSRLYRVNDDRIELRASRTIKDNETQMKIFTRHVFGLPRKS